MAGTLRNSTSTVEVHPDQGEILQENLEQSRVHRGHPILAKRGLTLHSGFLLSSLQLHPLSAKMCTDAPSATARMHAGVRSVLTFPAVLSILTTFSSGVMGARVPGTCTGGTRSHLRRVFDCVACWSRSAAAYACMHAEASYGVAACSEKLPRSCMPAPEGTSTKLYSWLPSYSSDVSQHRNHQLHR